MLRIAKDQSRSCLNLTSLQSVWFDDQGQMQPKQQRAPVVFVMAEVSESMEENSQRPESNLGLRLFGLISRGHVGAR